MTVENQFPRQEYTANGTDSHFALSFYVEDKTNFIVKLDEIHVSNTDYIYDNLTNTVKFNEAPRVGQVITIERNTSLDRAINYSTYNNTFRPETLNFDFDRIWRKLQELGVIDWILQNNIDALKGYVDTQDSELQNNIEGLKSYVDQKDSELKNYLLHVIQEQGVSLDKLDSYYDYLMERLADLAINKGWDTSLVVDKSGLTQFQINEFNLTPFHFGAIGDGISHKLSERYSTLEEAKVVYPHAIALTDEIDWCAVQALFNYVRFSDLTHLKYKIDISGYFMLTRGVQYKILASGQNTSRTISGDFIADCRNLEPTTKAVLEIHGSGIQFDGVLSINALDKADYCVWVSDGYHLASGQAAINFGIKLGRCFLNNARIFNIAFNDSAMFSTLDFYRGGGGGTKFTTKISNIIYESTNELSNFSLLTVDTLPIVEVANVQIFVQYNGKLSVVTEIDRANKTLRVFPAVKTGNLTQYQDATIFYGGGIETTGSNTAGLLINQMSTVLDVTGIAHHSMYPCQINYFCSEFSTISLYSNGLVGGIKCNHAYFEGDTWQYIQKTNGYGFSGATTIDYATGLEIEKHDVIQWGRDPITGYENNGFRGIDGYQLYDKGIKHLKNKLPANYIPNGYSLDFNKPYETKSEYVYSNMTISFTPINTIYNDLFGYDTQDVIIFGGGVNGAVTGNVTFKILDGYTLNGGTSDLIFSGFTSTAKFTTKLVVATKNIIVSCSTLLTMPLSNTALIPMANANDLPIDTKYWFNDTTTVTNLPIPTGGLQNKGNISTYYSYGKVGTSHNKTQVVEYPTLFEKWERYYSSSTGLYGAWKLVSYEIKKGTTVQRPSSPQLGYRYYDTTLLVTGKPIEWSGTAWIDSSGTTV